MLKLPKKNQKVKIGPFTYTVNYSEDTATEGDAYGSIHHKSQRIFIDPRNTDERKLECFLHELLHAVVYVNGLSFRWEAKPERRPDEEDAVREISTSFLQLMRDNPGLFE